MLLNSQEETLLHGYAYDAGNRLERAWNHKGEEATYIYNGMGQRVGKNLGFEQEEYILDLTRPYHNLLGIRRGEEEESYYWDFTPIATERKDSPPRYYLSDELGSPLRVLYSTGKGECYGYDEFGRDLSLSEKDTSRNRFTLSYTKQGDSQPFGYTGYRYDGISGSYFAQAREYQPEAGRFMAEDVIRGRMAVPKTLNRYGYCWGNPIILIDPDGNIVKEAYDLFIDYDDFEIDSYGIEIGLHYLFGGGKSLVDVDGRWGSYLMNNEILTEKVGNIVIPIGESLQEGTAINLSITTPMEIENGEGIQGYHYLHGTNGDMIFELCYKWNDIMDPNFIYSTDSKKAEFAKKIPFANPTDFNMHIIWRNTTVIQVYLERVAAG